MTSPRCERGSGGNIHRRPLRSRMARTPYDRPPSDECRRILEGNAGGWLPKFLEPASRFITRLFSSLFRSEEKTQAAVLPVQGVPDGHNSIKAIEQLLSQRRFTRAEANHVMKMICSRYAKQHMSESKNTSHEKESFFEDKISLYCELYESKTRHLPICSESVVSRAGVPVVPIMFSKTGRPRGRSAIYRMARSPYFMSDPSAELHMGCKNARNTRGWPVSSQWTSRSNLKSYEKKDLKRDASFLDVDCGLSRPRCKIPKRSMEEHYNEEPIAKDKSPSFAIYVRSDEDSKNLTESQSLKENETTESVLFTKAISGSSFTVNDMHDASTSSSTTPIRSVDSAISRHITLPSQRNSFFHMSDLEVLSEKHDEDDATSVFKGSFDTLPLQSEDEE